MYLSSDKILIKVKKIFSDTSVLFIVISLIFGVIFVFITPLLWGFDEIAHFNRVYQLSRGEIIPNTSKENLGGYIPKNLYELDYTVYADLMDNSNTGDISRTDITNNNNYRILGDRSFDGGIIKSPITTTYSPLAYIAPVFSLLITNLLHFNVENSIYVARLFSLLTYVLIVWLAIKYQKSKRLKWLLFTVALLPVSVFQASVITADGLAIALSILFISFLINILKDKKPLATKHLLIIASIAIALPLIKLNYIFLSLGILLVPANTFFNKFKSNIFKIVTILVSVILSGLWTFTSRPIATVLHSPRPDGLAVSSANQINHVLHSPLNFVIVFFKSIVVNSNEYLTNLYSVIGWNYVKIPIAISLIVFTVLLLSSLYIKDVINPIRNKIITLNILMFLGIVSIFIVMYVAFTPVGGRLIDGVQGRYFIPFIIPLLMLLSISIPVKVDIKENKAAMLFGLTAFLSLFVSAIYYYLVVH